MNFFRRAFRFLLRRGTPRQVNFAALQADLADSVAYELDVLEYLRASLLGQSEAADGGVSLTLGDIAPGGAQRAAAHSQGLVSSSEGAVHGALERLRPLAFSAAFKLQDMVVEWILHANGIHVWQFSKKVKEY